MRPESIQRHAVRVISILAALFILFATMTMAVESPSASGPVAMLDEPVFRIPFTRNPPTVDGRMEEGEWDDASALTAFWYDFSHGEFLYMAPHQTQLQVYACYDHEHLYVAFRSPVWPEGSWLRARGRFPNVMSHPMYGIHNDDKIEFELRPYHDAAKGYEMGLLKWQANSLGVFADQLWTVDEGGCPRYDSGAAIRSHVTGTLWTLEMKIPLENLVVGNYAAADERGRPIVELPPPDGTTYRFWFVRGIGGSGRFFNVFDRHIWNTTKGKMIFDSDTVGVQINELGRIMKDEVDVTVTLKNHARRSRTVQLGFFVENAEELIYTSYTDPQTHDGMIELVPGEVRQLNLRQHMPGISRDGNVLWFDVRSGEGALDRAGKALFQTRLVDFHSMDGGGRGASSFRERQLEPIPRMRPQREEDVEYFEWNYTYSPYNNRLGGRVDVGVDGADESVRRAAEARVSVEDLASGEEIVTETVPFHGEFAVFQIDMPELKTVGRYQFRLLLFDEDRRVVGKREPFPFSRHSYSWERNDLGTGDIVWEPFIPIEVAGDGFSTLKHDFRIGESGLPEQLVIRVDDVDLPLELRGRDEHGLSPGRLSEIGRGPQLREPVRIEAVVEGRRMQMEVVEPAELVRRWDSEIEYRSKLSAGPVMIELVTQYDCDGSMHVSMEYGSGEPVEIELLELVMDVAGPVDLRTGEQNAGRSAAAAPPSGWNLALPDEPGIVWDSSVHMQQVQLLHYNNFVPFFFFGSADRGFTWACDSDEHWELDRDGPAMTLERNEGGEVTWRVKFVNHPATVSGRKAIDFVLSVHPTRSRPHDHRAMSWFYDQHWLGGPEKNDALPNEGYGAIDGADETFGFFRRYIDNMGWKYPPRLHVHNVLQNGMPELQHNSYRSELVGEFSPTLIDLAGQRHPQGATGLYGQPYTRLGWARLGVEGGPAWEDLFVWHLERQIRLGGVRGWWWEEQNPPLGRPHANLASGGAYLRDPGEVGENELPWVTTYSSLNVRRLQKRLARLRAAGGVPCRNYVLAGNAASMLESFAWDSQLYEGAAAYSSTRDLDNITRFPEPLFRYMAGHHSGLITRITTNIGSDGAGEWVGEGEWVDEEEGDGEEGYWGWDSEGVWRWFDSREWVFEGEWVEEGVGNPLIYSGDEKRLDRAVLGRALLNDIGIGHGRLAHPQEAVRIGNILDGFGYFGSAMETEYIPYWRSDSVVRFGRRVEKMDAFALQTAEEDPMRQVYVSVYRRPFRDADGVQGYKAMFVIVNENREPVRNLLYIDRPEAVFGGPNTILQQHIIDDLSRNLPGFPASMDEPDLQGEDRAVVRRRWARTAGDSSAPALRDMEDGGAVARTHVGVSRAVARDEVYGPIYIPGRDFRILYGHFNPAE